MAPPAAERLLNRAYLVDCRLAAPYLPCGPIGQRRALPPLQPFVSCGSWLYENAGVLRRRRPSAAEERDSRRSRTGLSYRAAHGILTPFLREQSRSPLAASANRFAARDAGRSRAAPASGRSGAFWRNQRWRHSNAASYARRAMPRPTPEDERSRFHHRCQPHNVRIRQLGEHRGVAPVGLLRPFGGAPWPHTKRQTLWIPSPANATVGNWRVTD